MARCKCVCIFHLNRSMLSGPACHFVEYKQGRDNWNWEVALVFAVDFGSMAVVGLAWKGD